MRSEGLKNPICSTLVVGTGLGLLTLLSGCMTLEEMAPPVEGRFQVIAARHSVDTATLQLGRQVYLSDCVRCHSVEPIGRYTADEWRTILPKMAKESKLDAQRSQAVGAYVTLAHVLLAEIAEAEARSEVATGREQMDQEGGGATVAGRASR